MLFGGPLALEFHDLVIFKFGFADDLQLAQGLREDDEVGLVHMRLLRGYFIRQFVEILHDDLRVLSELNEKFLQLSYASELNVIASELEVELQLLVARELQT